MVTVELQCVGSGGGPGAPRVPVCISDPEGQRALDLGRREGSATQRPVSSDIGEEPSLPGEFVGVES